MNRRLLVTLTALAAIVAFGGGAYYYNGQRTPAAAAVTAVESTLVRPHSPILGKPDARVTIVEFFDPSCEACRAFYPIVKKVLATYPDDVRVVIRYTPFHDGSDEAVRILEAARKQDKFEPVLEAILTKQPEWALHGEPDLKRLWAVAAEAGLEQMGARIEGAKPEVDAVLKLDMEDVQTNKVEKTPTFFIGGQPLTNFSEQGLMDMVKSAVDAGA